MPLERVEQGFKDISATFKISPLNNDLLALKNSAAIARSLRNIVFTNRGEKFFNPNFGCDLKKSLSHSNEHKASYIVIVGEDEFNSNNYTLKNLTTGTQKSFSLDGLIEYIKNG